MTTPEHKRSLARGRRAAVATAIALTLALPPSAASAAGLPVIAPPPTAAEQFGANTGVLFNGGKYASAQVDQQVAALAQTGATVVRSDALWEKSEPQPPIGLLHRYDWSFDDRIVGALAAHGLQWLPIIDYSTSWAQSVRGQDHSPPATVSDYASYAGAVAGRYGPGGIYWLEHPQVTPQPVEAYEIWNEPDNPAYWYPGPNPALYADLYSSANAAITSVEPGARVIIGGLTRPAWFLSALLAADPGLRDRISAVGIHPYAANPGAVLANVRSARLAMRADGLASIPMYVTELGWQTRRRGGRDWAAASARPGYIAQTLSILGHTDCDVGAVLLYAWLTPQLNPANRQDWFGISPPGAGPTPDTAAFASGLRAATSPGPQSPVCSSAAVATSSQAAPRRSRPHRARRSHRTRAHRVRRRSSRR